MRRLLLLSTLFSALLSGCVVREDEVHSRNNIMDPGGGNWSRNKLPELKISFKENINGEILWHDFNFTDSTGKVFLSLNGSDSNAAYDPLNYKAAISKTLNFSNPLKRFNLDGSSTCEADSIVPGQTYHVRAVVYDSWGDSAVDTVSFSTSTNLPPLPPQNFQLLDNNGNIELIWDGSSTISYTVYRSTYDGPWEKLIAAQENSVFDYPGEGFYFYRIAASNKYGQSISPPKGALIPGYNYLSAPFLNEITQEEGYLNVSWNDYTSNIEFFYLFRAENPQGPYEFIAKLTVYNYRDEIPESREYYYRVASSDYNRNFSQFSDYRMITVEGPPAPELSASQGLYGEYVQLDWSTVAGAESYYLYRSTNYYDTVRIATVTENSYQDVVPDDSVYIYSVRAISNMGPGYPSSYSSGWIISPIQVDVDPAYTTDRSIYMSWGYEGYASIYCIYRSTDPESKFISIDSTYNTQYYDSTASHDSVYYYQVSMKMSSGEESRRIYSDSGRLKPVVPMIIEAKGLVGLVRLSWTKSAGADGYHIYRSNDYYDYTILGTITGADDTTFEDNTIDPSVVYYYYIDAYNSTGFSATDPFTASALMTPTQPYYPEATTDLIEYIQLSWYPNDTTEQVYGYVIYRSLDYDPEMSIPIDTTADTFYYDKVTDDAYYYYWVEAINAAGQSPLSSPVAGIRPRPGSPYNVAVSQGEFAGKVLISWESIEGVAGYNIYRAVAYYSTYELIGSSTEPGYFDTTAGDSTYYYSVTAYTAVGEGVSSSYVSGHPLLPPTDPYPENSVYGITVYWNEATGADEYVILRSTSETSGFTTINIVTGNYFLDEVQTADTYYYKIKSSNSSGLSNSSQTTYGAQRNKPSAPSIIVASDGEYTDAIRVSWQSEPGAETYRIYRSTSPELSTFTVLLTTTTDTTYLDSISTDSIYYYRIKSVNGAGASSISTQYNGGFLAPVNIPDQVIFIEASNSTYSDYIQLYWEHPLTGAFFNGFYIYRQGPGENEYHLIDSVDNITSYYYDYTAESFPDTYSYYIRAYNFVGLSEPSVIVTGSRTGY